MLTSMKSQLESFPPGIRRLQPNRHRRHNVKITLQTKGTLQR